MVLSFYSTTLNRFATFTRFSATTRGSSTGAQLQCARLHHSDAQQHVKRHLLQPTEAHSFSRELIRSTAKAQAVKGTTGDLEASAHYDRRAYVSCEALLSS